MFNDDAFDIFDESHKEDFSAVETTEVARPSKKRENGVNQAELASLRAVLTKDGADREMADMVDEEDANQPAKRSRTAAPMPTVTDSFEQDLEREVASAAGLMPSAEGANVVLSHQVGYKETAGKTALVQSI